MAIAAHAGAVTDNGSTAQMGPVAFTSGADFSAGQTAGGFMVCGGSNGTHCETAGSDAGNGQGFAAVDITGVALPNSGDSPTTTRTFDISTPGA